MFFVFDGMDGAGKSTQLDRFSGFLSDAGHDVVTCKDPGTTQLGDELRGLLLQERGLNIHMRSELLMFMTARSQLTQEFIQPALDAGKTVVCDRYVFSTVVYQGYGGDIDPQQVWDFNHYATSGLVADLTFIFDLDPNTAQQRIGKERDRMESRGLEYFETLRHGFITEAKRFPVGVEMIDASGTPDEVFDLVLAAAAPFLKSKPT
jgi:dTMP kinase